MRVEQVRKVVDGESSELLPIFAISSEDGVLSPSLPPSLSFSFSLSLSL